MGEVIDILSLVPQSLNLRSNHLWLDYDDEADVLYISEKTATGNRQRNGRALHLSSRRKRAGRRHCPACQIQRGVRRRLVARLYALPCCRGKGPKFLWGVRSGSSGLCRGRRIEGGGSIVDSRGNCASLRGVEGTGSTDSGSCLHKRSRRSRSRITRPLRGVDQLRTAQIEVTGRTTQLYYSPHGQWKGSFAFMTSEINEGWNVTPSGTKLAAV